VLFCPKDRRPVLVDAVAARLKELVLVKQDENGDTVLGVEVLPDHVHLLLDVDPRIGVASVVAKIKGYTSRELRAQFPRLRRRLPTLWTRSKFISSTQQVHLLCGGRDARRGAGIHRQPEGHLSMQIRRAYKYRLYPTRGQAEKLERVLDWCRELYNAALQERRDAYRMAGVTISYYAQKRELPGVKEVRPEYRQVGSQVLQDVIQRIERAFAAFFRRCKAGEKPGYPRFRDRDRYDSFTYTQAGWKLDGGRLLLTGIGALKVKWSQPIAGAIKTVTVRRSADQCYVCFSCMVEIAQPAAPDRPAVGIDVGLEHFATLSTGQHIPNPRHFRHGAAVLAQRQQALARQKRGSRNRRRAKVLVARAHRKIRDQRRDFHHKTARHIVRGHGAIAVESLRVANMVRNPSLAKSISDAGWNQFLAILSAKAEEAGLLVVVVNPAGTSQECSGCGRSVPKDLSVRWHTCPYEDCGLSLGRDHNSARAILNRAGLADPLRGYPVASAPAAESHGL
jgi:putative transposase